MLKALPLILDGLKERGLKPVTLDKLLGKPGYVSLLMTRGCATCGTRDGALHDIDATAMNPAPLLSASRKAVVVDDDKRLLGVIEARACACTASTSRRSPTRSTRWRT